MESSDGEKEISTHCEKYASGLYSLTSGRVMKYGTISNTQFALMPPFLDDSDLFFACVFELLPRYFQLEGLQSFHLRWQVNVLD